MYESLNAVFGKGQKPLLLLIDDLQWCDHDSFEWLHSFFRSEASAGTLVLGTVILYAVLIPGKTETVLPEMDNISTSLNYY